MVKSYVIKDNQGNYAYGESFCVDTYEGKSIYLSFKAMTEGIYMSYINEQAAMKTIAKLDKEKTEYRFPELEFHVEETTRKALRKEMIGSKNEKWIIAKRECAA